MSIPKDSDKKNMVKYKNISTYMGIVVVATLLAGLLTLVQKRYELAPFILIISIISLVITVLLHKEKITMNALKAIMYVYEVIWIVIFPIIYAHTGGISSTTSIWLFLALYFTIVAFDGIIMHVFLTVQLLTYCATIVVDYNKIINVVGVLSRKEIYMSFILALIVVSLLLGYYILSQIKYNVMQTQRLEQEILETKKERDQAEELMIQYEEQKAIAEKALNTKSEFINNINSEIRSPLNAILGLTGTILKLNDVDEIHRVASNISNAARGVSFIISDILDYSAEGDTNITLNPRPYDTEIIFNSFRNMIVPRLEAKGIEFILERDRIPKMLVGDLTRIQQVLFKIGNNAIKYTEKGSVTFKVYYDFDKSELMLAVTDTGCGIKEKDLPLLFDAPKQGEPDTSLGPKGGMGLPLCKKIIDVMDGTITVQSSFGNGTTFIIKVPQPQPDAKMMSVPEEKFDFSGKKILYVDVTPANHIAVDAVLLDTGAHVGHAMSAKEAIDMPVERLKEFDLLIIDYDLMGIDGGQMLLHFREKGITAPGICVYSGQLDEETVAMYRKKGFAAFIPKPIEKEVLRKANELLYPKVEKIM